MRIGWLRGVDSQSAQRRRPLRRPRPPSKQVLHEQHQGGQRDGDARHIERQPGERRERDSGQALYEEQYATLTGKRFVVPQEGYDTPILLHPQAFEYYQAAPGLEIKNLGCFFDHPGPNADIRLSVVRLSPGAAYHFGLDRAQIAWTTDAGLHVGDRTYPELTYLYSPRGEKAEISAESTAEVFVVEFPRLD